MRFIAILLSVLLVIVGVKLAISGNKLYDESQVYPQPEHLSYEKFARERPLVGWYEVTGGLVDFSEGAYAVAQTAEVRVPTPTPNDLARLARSVVVYLPVHNGPATEVSPPADIILFTRDPELVQAVHTLSAEPPKSAHTTESRTIRGMVHLPSELPDDVRRCLGPSILTQSIIIEENAAPSARRAIRTMGAGAAMLLVTALFWLFTWRHERISGGFPPEFIPEELLGDLADDDIEDLEHDEGV